MCALVVKTLKNKDLNHGFLIANLPQGRFIRIRERSPQMVANDVIDFLMEELVRPATCPLKIRKAVKQLVGIHARTSIGRRMLTERLIDALFDLYERGMSDAIELGMALKAKLNRYIHSRFMPLRHPGIVLPLRGRSFKFSV
ncbi:MAG: hypothetical protein QM647_18715 [Asticcacaulis sp.]